MNWHVTSFARVIAVGKELAHEFLEGESALLKYPRFPVLGENYVVRRQCGGRANGDAFLSRRNLRKGQPIDTESICARISHTM